LRGHVNLLYLDEVEEISMQPADRLIL
jgi:hypothetical protein